MQPAAEVCALVHACMKRDMWSSDWCCRDSAHGFATCCEMNGFEQLGTPVAAGHSAQAIGAVWLCTAGKLAVTGD